MRRNDGRRGRARSSALAAMLLCTAGAELALAYGCSGTTKPSSDTDVHDSNAFDSGASQDGPHDAVSDRNDGARSDVSQDAFPDAPQDAAQDSMQDSMRDVTQDVAQDIQVITPDAQDAGIQDDGFGEDAPPPDGHVFVDAPVLDSAQPPPDAPVVPYDSPAD